MRDFIDAAVEQFARDHTERESDLHVRLREETYRVMDRPQMQVDAIEGRFLKMLVRLTSARTILEIGMFLESPVVSLGGRSIAAYHDRHEYSSWSICSQRCLK